MNLKDELPPDEMRELVINAFAHRSYLEHDAPVFLAIYDNCVEITSPGGLPRGQTADRAFAGYSKIRNDVLAKALNYMRYIEEWGSGLRRVNRVLAEYGIYPVVVDEAVFATQMNVYRVTDSDNEGNREGNNEGNDPNGIDDGTNGTNGGTNDPNREGNPKRISGAGAPVTAPLTAPVNEPVNEPVTSANKLLRIIRENPGRRKQELVALSGLRLWTVKRLLEGVLKGIVEYRGACRNGGYFVVDEDLKA